MVKQYEIYWVALDPTLGSEILLTSVQATEIANEKLNALIEAAPLIYSNPDSQGILSEWDKEEKGPYPGDTHKARLMFVEELGKEPCKHCGIELRATWEAK